MGLLRTLIAQLRPPWRLTKIFSTGIQIRGWLWWACAVLISLILTVLPLNFCMEQLFDYRVNSLKIFHHTYPKQSAQNNLRNSCPYKALFPEEVNQLSARFLIPLWILAPTCLSRLTRRKDLCTQYLNCKILHGGTLLQPWPNAFGMLQYFSEDYMIPSPKLNEHQEKKVFAENWSVFSPKLGEELGLFCLIIQRSNLDKGTSKSRWGGR